MRRQVSQVNRIIYHLNFIWRDVIILDNHILGDTANRDNSICHHQPLLFNLMHQGITRMLTRAIKLSSMHMNNQRSTRHLLGDHAGLHRQPVVSMNGVRWIHPSELPDKLAIAALQPTHRFKFVPIRILDFWCDPVIIRPEIMITRR